MLYNAVLGSENNKWNNTFYCTDYASQEPRAKALRTGEAFFFFLTVASFQPEVKE